MVHIACGDHSQGLDTHRADYDKKEVEEGDRASEGQIDRDGRTGDRGYDPKFWFLSMDMGWVILQRSSGCHIVS